MSWTFNGRGKNETSGAPKKNNPEAPMIVATETVSLGAGKAGAARYSSVIDFIPCDESGKQIPFTIVSNTGTTNTSGSVADQLYACHSRAGTFFLVKAHLRDCNYADFTKGVAAGGVALGSVDSAIRTRYVDPDFVGAYPYYKVKLLAADVESSAKTIALAVTVGMPDKGSWKVNKS